jgi:hypothetical protein
MMSVGAKYWCSPNLTAWAFVGDTAWYRFALGAATPVTAQVAKMAK